MAKDSAEKGLSEEAVNLFDLAKVHYCTVCRHVTSDFICKVKLQCTCNARTSFILLVSELNYSCQFKRHYTLMVIVLIIFLIIKVSVGYELICLEKLGWVARLLCRFSAVILQKYATGGSMIKWKKKSYWLQTLITYSRTEGSWYLSLEDKSSMLKLEQFKRCIY